MYTILFITHYQEMYGANKSLLRLILELRENFSIKPVVLLRSKGTICDVLDDKNIKYHVSHFYWWVYEGSKSKIPFHNFLKQVRNILRIKKIIHTISVDHIDLVYSNSITINIGYLISRKLECPHIWHIRETFDAYKFRFSLGNMLSKCILQNGANKYIVISEYLKNWYKRYLPLEKVELIYNGIEQTAPLRKINQVKSFLNLCIIGILCDQKNQMEALQALDILVNKNGKKNIRLHLVGAKHESYYQILIDFTQKNELKDFVIFHGHIAEIHDFLHEMNLGIVCARDEAFGRVTIEYMYSRMPVIACNSGANQELVQEGKTGFLYHLKNYSELAEKILIFYNNSSLIEEFGTYAQGISNKNFSSEKNTMAISKVIFETLKEN